MPHLIGIVGPLGAGKSTAASLFPWLWKNGVEARGGHLELFANYDLHGAERLDKTEDWFKVADVHGSVCIWDEAHRTFDSRRFSSFQNIFATELLTFCRKMAAIQVFATPSIQRLDTRIREILEILVVVRKHGHGTYYDFYDYQADFAGRYGRFLHSLYLPKKKLNQIYKLNLFDSHSFVGKFPMPKTEKESISFMDTLEEIHHKAIERERRKKNDVTSSTTGQTHKKPAKPALSVS